MKSVRTQITAGVAVLVLVVVALAGLVITLRIDHRDREDVDREMITQAGKAQQDVDKLRSEGDGPAADYGGLQTGAESLVRLLSGDRVVSSRGAPLLDRWSLDAMGREDRWHSVEDVVSDRLVAEEHPGARRLLQVDHRNLRCANASGHRVRRHGRLLLIHQQQPSHQTDHRYGGHHRDQPAGPPPASS